MRDREHSVSGIAGVEFRDTAVNREVQTHLEDKGRSKGVSDPFAMGCAAGETQNPSPPPRSAQAA